MYDILGFPILTLNNKKKKKKKKKKNFHLNLFSY